MGRRRSRRIRDHGAALHQVVFGNDGEGIALEALADTRALLMSGEPIGETIVSYGPFVMNTDEEIRAAYRDYRAGAMGLVEKAAG